ncbi:hypothetical protein NDU88_004031 [Pleurodeles waltl]|uniref:Uncharacterized protein n=1 Tax=Pleurodeles waltl TaxID=8319 RepID=A0AAV7T7Z6_PLEWA|nr:hypothetical protein NDU88_004031 [Pleurodeles waltl]
MQPARSRWGPSSAVPVRYWGPLRSPSLSGFVVPCFLTCAHRVSGGSPFSFTCPLGGETGAQQSPHWSASLGAKAPPLLFLPVPLLLTPSHSSAKGASPNRSSSDQLRGSGHPPAASVTRVSLLHALPNSQSLGLHLLPQASASLLAWPDRGHQDTGVQDSRASWHLGAGGRTPDYARSPLPHLFIWATWDLPMSGLSYRQLPTAERLEHRCLACLSPRGLLSVLIGERPPSCARHGRFVFYRPPTTGLPRPRLLPLGRPQGSGPVRLISLGWNPRSQAATILPYCRCRFCFRPPAMGLIGSGGVASLAPPRPCTVHAVGGLVSPPLTPGKSVIEAR